MLRRLVSPVFPFGSPTPETASPTSGATPSQTRLRYSISGRGCLCNFSTDCQGSSYLSDGCQDIDECKDKEDGDPFTDGVCYRKSLSLAMKLLIGVSFCLVLLFGFINNIMHERRKNPENQRRIFQAKWRTLAYLKR